MTLPRGYERKNNDVVAPKNNKSYPYTWTLIFLIPGIIIFGWGLTGLLLGLVDGLVYGAPTDYQAMIWDVGGMMLGGFLIKKSVKRLKKLEEEKKRANGTFKGYDSDGNLID